MRALLLAAGLGTRLRPFTFFRAKACLPILNVPFIHYALQYLHLNAVEEVVINLHAHPDTVRKASGKEFHGIAIHYSHEPEILGTAGAIRKASPMLGDEPFAVMNSDMLTYIPLSEVLQQHLREDADVTLVVMRASRFSHYGALYFDETGSGPPRLRGLRSEEGEPYHYTGLQVVSPRVIQWIPENQKTEVFLDIYPRFVSERRIHGFVYDGFWMEIGTLRDYLHTGLELIRQPLPVALEPPGMERSLVSPEARVEEGATVNDSILMNGAVVKAGVHLDHCIIGWDTTITGSAQNVALIRGILPWHIYNERRR